jgi:hypothetical protein
VKKILVLLLWLLVQVVATSAQVTVKGVVEDSATHERLVSASVMYQRKGKTVQFSRTNAHGEFAITVDNVVMGDQLQATMLGYGKRRCGVPMRLGRAVVLSLPAQSFALKEVKVQGSRVTGRDTITFDLTRFTNERDNSLKDVLKKLPGVEVAANGKIYYNNQAVSRFTVEGLDLTGGRYNLLTENIRAKDVKKAEIVEHDQPVKALRDKVYSDNVGMNVTLKDEARDRLMATLIPYLLVGDPTHVGGKGNIRQIGKKKQLMYDMAYDRKGIDLSDSYLVLGSNYNRLDGAEMPVWYSVPSLSAPLDEERLRFNTSQRYGVSGIRKTKGDNELRVAAQYNRSVVRQTTENHTSYNLDGEAPTMTTEQQHKTLISDHFAAEMEHKVNTDDTYGNELLRVSARQDDALSVLGPDLPVQRMRVPDLDLEGSVYRMTPLKGGAQLTWKSILDYHHSVSDLYLDGDRNRLRTNLWHTAHLLGWQRKRGLFTQDYSLRVEGKDVHVNQTDNLHLTVDVRPSWQYQTQKLNLSLSPTFTFERLVRQQETMLYLHPSFSAYWRPSSRSEIRFYSAYSQHAGDMQNYAIDSYRRNYRTWYQASDFVPVSRQLYGLLGYQYKRPVRELFATASISVQRSWSNATTDMQIVDGNYYYTLQELHSKNDRLSASTTVSKGFYALKTKLSLGVNGSLGRGSQLSAGHWYDYTTQSLTLTPGIIVSPDWCEFDYEGSFSVNANKTSGHARTSLFNWRQRLLMTTTVGNVDLSWKFVHYRNELQAGNTLNTLLSDAAITWRLKKVRLKALLQNIFDKQAYEETTYTGVATSTTSYLLRPRELILSVQFSL